MSLIRCPSCGHDNAAESRFCSDCGGALDIPPHLIACLRCGSINPVSASVCLWCHGNVRSRSHWRRLRGRPARVVVAVAATALPLLAVLGYYVYPRDSSGNAPATSGAGIVEPTVLPRETLRADRGITATDAPRENRQPAEKPAAKTAAAARPQVINPRKAGEREAPVAQACPDAVAALGLCSKTAEQEPPRTQPCTEGAAALGLCASNNIQRRE